MTFAKRLKISSLLSLSLLVFVAGLLTLSSRELKQAVSNNALADEIETIIFQRATLRDEYFLYGLERARLQWFALNRETAVLIEKGGGRFGDQDERRLLEKVQADFGDSVLISRRLVEQVLRLSVKDWELAHHDDYANRLYVQIMLKDSALQRSSASLQNLARERFNKAVDRTLVLTFLFVLLVVAGSVANASLINNLLRRRLTMLKEGTAIIASGDLSHRMQCEGSDELAELGRVINAVVGQVEKSTAELQKSHHLLNDLSSQVPGILFQAHLRPEGGFSTPYASRGGQDVYPGGAEQALAGSPSFFATFHPHEYPAILASFLESAALLQPWEYEYRLGAPDGGVRWLRGQARPMRLEDGGTLWHGFIYDLTERKLMEQALHQSEERARLQLQELTNIYTHTPVGLFAVDRDLRFLRLNERLAEINGKSIEEHLGRTVDETLPADLAATLKEIWQPVLERGECVLDAELHGTVSGSPDIRQDWLVSYQPILSDAGAVNGLMGFVLDITERKRAEQVMAGAREELELEVRQRTANLSLANEHLLQEIEVRKKVEVELLAQQQKLQEMALDVSMAEERERDRIASELHDQVGQRLILAKIRIDTLASRLPHGEYEAEAAGVETLIEQTIQDIRSLTFQIRPPLLASAGLEAALRWLGEELQADFGLEVTFSDDGREKPLRYEVRSTVFQAVRELMLNVAKHAGTKQCRVGFSRLHDNIVVQVDDDGVGLKPGVGDGSSARSGGFGLQNARQKIGHLGGALAIEAKGERGTRAVITVPLEKTQL